MPGPQNLAYRLALIFGLLAACSDDGSATNRSESPAYTGVGAFLDACDDGRDCQAGLCLALETGVGICTHTCKRAAECPKGANWGCGDTAEAETAVCVCAADGAEELCGDGRDNDCDGKLDDCLTCGARLVQPNDRLNCGACGHECAAGAVCEERVCVCPAGVAGCDPDPSLACRADADCDDHVGCTVDACSDGQCGSRLDAASCGAGTSCDPRAALCVAGPVCADDEDCADRDSCTLHEHCDASSRRCVYDILDGDGDGHAPVVCGGDDCDDADPAVLPGAAELCDQRDNDCDGALDDGLLGATCGEGAVCTLLGCACAPGYSTCDGACVALSADEGHCGACGNACSDGSSCIDGICDCADDTLLCHGACMTLEELASDARNCGGCGHTCAEGDLCVDGACTCGPDAVLCAGECLAPAAFESSAAHCGTCGNACAGACVAGECTTAVEVVTSFASSCVVFADGRAACFGRAGGGVFSLLRDRADHPITGVVQLVINDSPAGPYLCARLANGQLHCGGDPLLHDLQDATRVVPVYSTGLVQLDSVVDVKLGSDASCALLADGRVSCWGPNVYGGAGVGTRGASAIARPVQLAGGGTLGDALTISLVPYLGQACAARRDASVVCWGSNERGEAQPGASTTLLSAVTVRDAEGSALAGVRDVAVGASASCALLADGRISCWGGNERGQLGRSTGSAFPATVLDANGSQFSSAAALIGNYAAFCALDEAAGLWCWGNNDQGQLGDGSVEVRRFATPVLGGVSQLGLSVNHGCALDAAGGARCWGGSAVQGSAASDQSITLYPQPLQDADGISLRGVRRIASGGQHSCLVDSAGKVACWGDNAFGQAGGLDGVSSRAPRRLPGW